MLNVLSTTLLNLEVIANLALLITSLLIKLVFFSAEMGHKMAKKNVMILIKLTGMGALKIVRLKMGSCVKIFQAIVISIAEMVK